MSDFLGSWSVILPIWRVIMIDKYTHDEQIILETRSYREASECIDSVKNDPLNKDHRYTAYTEKIDF